MSQITFPHIDLKNTKKCFVINSKLKICIECGHSNVDSYEFGISCENCGSLFVFSPLKNQKISRRYDF